MARSTQTKKEKGGHPAVYIVNENEKYLFCLYNTGHKVKNGMIRPYLFHYTCAVFAQYSPPRKKDYLTKNKLCHICSLATAVKRHKEPCAMSERFKCKVCTEIGDFAGALTYHTELHQKTNGKAQPKRMLLPKTISSQ